MSKPNFCHLVKIFFHFFVLMLIFDQVFEETLRLYPPAPSTVKTAPAGFVLGGYAIPEGTMISVSCYM